LFVRALQRQRLHLDNSPALLEGNSFSANQIGLLVENVVVSLVANGSSFTGNSTAGAAAANSGLLDARDSWWGDASGPQHAGNPGGLGDPVGAGVLFDPWFDGIGRATISVAAAPPDGGTVSGGGTFPLDGEITVTAQAAGAYGFDGWFEGETIVAAQPEYSFIVTMDRELTARFTLLPVEFTITATAGAGGFIEPAGSVAVAQGGDQFFAAYPEFGYQIADLVVDGVSQGPGTGHYFENVQANHTIHAEFEEIPPPLEFTITATAGAGGFIEPAGSVAVAQGGDQFFAVYPENGYEIADLIVDGVSQGPGTGHYFENVQANHTIHAEFEEIPPPLEFTITATATAGGFIEPSGSVAVAQGGDQFFAVYPEDGFEIADLIVDGVSQGPGTGHYFENVQANHTIHAEFEEVTPPEEFVIFASATTGGGIYPFGIVTVPAGEAQSFWISPEEGYEIENVFIDGSPIGPVAEVHFPEVWFDFEIQATFRPLSTVTHVVSVASADPALGSVAGGGTFAAGTEVTVTATPAAGAQFVNWTEDGGEVSAAPEYTFTLGADRDLVAHFETLPPARVFTASYAAGPDLNIPRNAPVQRAIIGPDGRALMICGTTSNYVSLGNAEWFNPADNTFTTLAMNSIRGSGPVVVPLADGRHLIAGGDSNLGVPAYKSAEIFDPVAGSFTATGAMQQVRASASGIRLGDGRVLVAGAWYRNYANTAELYDPAAGTFSQLASTMSEGRTRPALLPRADGTVLVVGGYAPYNGAPLQSIDGFDPATGTFEPVSGGIYLPADGVNFSTRHDYMVELVDGTWLVLGHAVVGSEWHPRAMIYDPQSGHFTPTTGQPPAGFYAGPQWLPDLGIAVCTTFAEGGVFGVMIYDPQDGRFQVPPQTQTLPANHTMGGNSGIAVLPDGRLLVAGGTERTGGQFNYGAIANTLLVSLAVEEPPPPPPPPPLANWVVQNSGTEASLQTVFFVDDQTGWVGGSDWHLGIPVLLKTTDAGTTWLPLNPGPGSSVDAIQFLDALNGWILVNTYGHMDSESRLMQTSDGGTTWTTRFAGTNTGIYCLHFLDQQHGWAGGSTLLRTSDGGQTWTTHAPPPGHDINDLYFADANTGWAAGSDSENWAGVILKTTDGGSTWAPQTIHDGEEMGHVFQLWFHNATEAVALGGHGVVLETSNGGADWHRVPDLPFGFPQKIVFSGPDDAWMVGSWMGWDLGPPYPEDAGFSIMGSTDGGATWTPDLGAATRDVWMADCHFSSARHGWAVGDMGLILKYTVITHPPPPGYDDWAAGHFTPEEFAAGLHLPDADPGDLGIPNLTRYALGLGARNPRRDWLPQPNRTGDGPEGFTLWISLPDPVPPDVEILLGASAGLAAWDEYPQAQWVIEGEGTSEGRRHLLVRPPAFPGDGRSLFLNLIIRQRTTP
jgi:photosystem II stability/assembly factor-like uncharacterized protein